MWSPWLCTVLWGQLLAIEYKPEDFLGHPFKGTAACCLNLSFWRYISWTLQAVKLILLVHLANPLSPAHSFKPANPLQSITPSSQQICHMQFIPLSPVSPTQAQAKHFFADASPFVSFALEDVPAPLLFFPFNRLDIFSYTDDWWQLWDIWFVV